MKVTEVAVTINRYQTIIFSRRQKLFIVCSGSNGANAEMQSMVEGLGIVILPKEKDCTVPTLAH